MKIKNKKDAQLKKVAK